MQVLRSSFPALHAFPPPLETLVARVKSHWIRINREKLISSRLMAGYDRKLLEIAENGWQ
jgi:hypothetical protein